MRVLGEGAFLRDMGAILKFGSDAGGKRSDVGNAPSRAGLTQGSPRPN